MKKESRFRLDIRKNLSEGVVGHWNILPGEVVKSLSHEALMKCVAWFSGAWFSEYGGDWSKVGLDNLSGLIPTYWFHDSITRDWRLHWELELGKKRVDTITFSWYLVKDKFWEWVHWKWGCCVTCLDYMMIIYLKIFKHSIINLTLLI